MNKGKTTANALGRVSPNEDDEQQNLHHGKAVEGPEAQVLGVFILGISLATRDQGIWGKPFSQSRLSRRTLKTWQKKFKSRLAL